MWWKEHKWKVMVPVVVLAVLAGAFWLGGEPPVSGGGGTAVQPTAPAVSSPVSTPTPTAPPESTAPVQSAPAEDPPAPEPSPQTTSQAAAAGGSGGETAPGEGEPAAGPTGESTPGQTEGEPSAAPGPGGMMGVQMGNGRETPEGRPEAMDPETVTISDTARTCTLSISCAAILNTPDRLDPEKAELVPEDGWVLPPTQVTFYEGESVFNVLQRTCKQNKIHMEFSNTPLYHSAYIEGIHNLYELDCGELSGWMYRVNDWFPNYGCSRYGLRDGDVVCWEYTCDLGADIGGFFAGGN